MTSYPTCLYIAVLLFLIALGLFIYYARLANDRRDFNRYRDQCNQRANELSKK